MPLIDDIRLDPSKTDPRIQQIITQIIDIINTGGYQQPTYAQAPLAGDPGFEGEVRNVLIGAVMKEYKYISGNWYKSDATVSGGWSVVT